MSTLRQYTVYNQMGVEDKIQTDIRLLKNNIRKSFKDDICSIWLIGGYGRGEGGVRIVGLDVFPKNNYDFLLVVKNGVNKDIINERIKLIKMQVSKSISVEVEMSFQYLEKLYNVANIMIYRDIYEMGYCLYGIAPRDILPDKLISDMPKVEALKIIRNRGMLWLAVRDKISHLNYKCTSEQRLHWLNKVLFGYLDAFLIVQGKYCVSYKEKVNRLNTINTASLNIDNTKFIKFKSLINKATLSRFYDVNYSFENKLLEIESILYMIHSYVYQQIFDRDESLVSYREYTGVIGSIKSIIRSLDSFGIVGAFSSFFIHPVDLLNMNCAHVFYQNIVNATSKTYMSPFSPFKKISNTELSRDLMRIYVRDLV